MQRLTFLLAMILLGWFSCGDPRPEVGLELKVQELSDGFSPYYRYSLLGEILPQEENVLWFFGDQEIGSGLEAFFAFPQGNLPSQTPIRAEVFSQDYRFSVDPWYPDQDTLTFSEPGDKKYLTIPGPSDPFLLVGELLQKLGPTSLEDGLEELVSYGQWGLYRAKRPGFYNLTTQETLSSSQAQEPMPREHQYNIFVSPVASVHLDRVDRDWYYTQFRTSTTSNCGPTVVSMALEWAKGYELPVSEVRRMIGWRGAGGVTLEEMSEVLSQYEVNNRVVPVDSPQDIFAILEAGNLVGLVYDMAGLEEVKDPVNNLLGQYYTDRGGHYLAVKGYSLDKQYFIIYDPIPADWTENDQRYHDQESMWGRNRYYPAEELFEALRRNTVIEIFPAASPG
jgi:hypothetical protein